MILPVTLTAYYREQGTILVGQDTTHTNTTATMPSACLGPMQRSYSFRLDCSRGAAILRHHAHLLHIDPPGYTRSPNCCLCCLGNRVVADSSNRYNPALTWKTYAYLH